eukprot:1151115-Pelagomonas_calceolata.AAC.6
MGAAADSLPPSTNPKKVEDRHHKRGNVRTPRIDTISFVMVTQGTAPQRGGCSQSLTAGKHASARAEGPPRWASMCGWGHAAQAESAQKSTVGASMQCHLCTAGCDSVRDGASTRTRHGHRDTIPLACRSPACVMEEQIKEQERQSTGASEDSTVNRKRKHAYLCMGGSTCSSGTSNELPFQPH